MMGFWNSDFAAGTAIGIGALTALFILSNTLVSCANDPTWAERCIDNGGEYSTTYDGTSDNGSTETEECELP